LIVDILEHRGHHESQSAVDGVLRCCRLPINTTILPSVAPNTKQEYHNSQRAL